VNSPKVNSTFNYKLTHLNMARNFHRNSVNSNPGSNPTSVHSMSINQTDRSSEQNSPFASPIMNKKSLPQPIERLSMLPENQTTRSHTQTFTPGNHRINLTHDQRDKYSPQIQAKTSHFNFSSLFTESPQKKVFSQFPETSFNRNTSSMRHSISPTYAKNFSGFSLPNSKSYLERLVMREYHHPCEEFQKYMLELKKQISESRKLKSQMQN
jgi:hypothetical protein